MNTQGGAVERMNLSFKILKDNFLSLTIPLFAYQLLSYVLIGSMIMAIAISSLKQDVNSGIDMFNFIDSPIFVGFIATGIIFYVLYLILLIPIIIGLIKSIKQVTQGETVTIIDNIKYGFDNLFSSFKTYWYIFQYVALIPALLFIAGGIISIIGLVSQSIIFNGIGWLMIGISFILGFIFAVTRGVKSSLALTSAIDCNEFTKDNFLKSVNSTDGKWGKIVRNFLLLRIVLILISVILSTILGLFMIKGATINDITSPGEIEQYLNSFSIVTQIINGILNQILSTITLVLSTIFVYLLYQNIKNEVPSNEVQNSENSQNINQEQIEL